MMDTSKVTNPDFSQQNQPSWNQQSWPGNPPNPAALFYQSHQLYWQMIQGGKAKTHFRLVKEVDFEREVLKNPLPVVVFFTSKDCDPCKLLKPIVEEIALEYQGKVSFVLMDDDELSEDFDTRWKVESLPFFLLFKNGMRLASHSGLIITDDEEPKTGKLLKESIFLNKRAIIKFLRKAAKKGGI